EGYRSNRKTSFWQDAQRALSTLASYDLPFLSHFEINAVFAPSNRAIGTARDLGDESIVWDSFLGLYFPYWNPFGRWYHVVYPTDFAKFRDGIGSVPYDYKIVLID